MRELVERWYSSAFYPASQHIVTSISNLTPIAFLDCAVAAALIGLGVLWWSAFAKATAGKKRRVVRAGVITLTGAVGIYILFQLVWGLNYQRVKLADKLELDRPAPSTADVVRLGDASVTRLNALHDAAHAQGWPDEAWKHRPLLDASARVQRMLGARRPAVAGRLKQSAFGVVFRWNGVDGMINPFGLEVLVNPDLLPFERPFVAAHEWAHLAGYADESEANFVGWLTTVGADAASQYSGWLYLYWQVAGELSRHDAQALAERLAAGPRRDVNAIVERLRRGEWAPLRRLSWAAYDQYLKANAVQSGVHSYGEVVTLLLMARFEDGWRPVRRVRAAPRQ